MTFLRFIRSWDNKITSPVYTFIYLHLYTHICTHMHAWTLIFFFSLFSSHFYTRSHYFQSTFQLENDNLKIWAVLIYFLYVLEIQIPYYENISVTSYHSWTNFALAVMQIFDMHYILSSKSIRINIRYCLFLILIHNGVSVLYCVYNGSILYIRWSFTAYTISLYIYCIYEMFVFQINFYFYMYAKIIKRLLYVLYILRKVYEVIKLYI